MYPMIAQKIFVPLQERLKRKPTFRLLRELAETERLSEGDLRALQLARLRELLEYARREVPYYRRCFDKAKIQPAELKSLRDFASIPYLDKETIRARGEELRPEARRAGVQRMSTGGSTGTPVAVYVDRERAAFTDAARMRAQSWFGIVPGAREIALWGSPIELGRQDRLRGMRDRLINSRFLAAFNMGEREMADYAATIRRYRPEKMYGYASAFYLLAEYLRGRSWAPPAELKVIFVTAEPLYDFQRDAVERVFGCAVAVEYGARDAGLMANQCPAGGLHIPAEGMLIEIDAPDATGLGEIVATNFFSRAMPIIRYRTGDMGRLIEGTCACGRALPRLESVEGRRTDFLVTPSGRLLHALAVIYPLRECASIKRFQVVQEAIDRIIVRVVGNPSSKDIHELSQKLQSTVGAGIKITIDCVAEIPSAASGKYRYVISPAADEAIKNLGAKPMSAAV